MNRFARNDAMFAVLLIVATSLPSSTFAQVAEYGNTEKKGEYESYVAQDGTHYKLGDEVKVGEPHGGNKTFSYVNEYLGFLTESTPCPSRCAGLDYKIVNFRAGGKGQGFRMWAMLKPANGGRGTLTVNFEQALESGELIGRGYTSDQALAELKKWKDKLDLELITKEEYEVRKEELSKFIR